MNKKTVYKILAGGTCACLLTGSVAFGVYDVTRADNKEASQASEEEIVEQTKEVLDNFILSSTDATATIKDETVYVITKADGTISKVIVSDWIKNATGDKTVSDTSSLSDIEVTKGDATYSIDADNALVWDAQGQDVYYQGTTKAELPVSLKITYMLDGKPVSADELAGKSGKVTMRFEYTNNTKQVVEINGKEEYMYVPFAMMTGMVLEDDNFRNISVTNGKIINDGNRTFVVGLAFPGLQTDLDIDKDKLEIPDFFEVTADVKDFSLGMTATIATNDVFNKVNTEDMATVDDLSSSLGELTDAMDKLLDGSSQLYDGMCTLLDKSDELVKGVNQLADGAGALKEGAAKVDAGAGQLQGGAAQLQTGLNTLTANNDKLNGGAKQVFETLLATANTQIAQSGLSVPTLTIDNYGETLTGVIESLDKDKVYEQAHTQVAAAVDAMGDSIYASYIDSIADSVYATYIDSIADTIYAKYINDNADALNLYGQYIKSIESNLYAQAVLPSIKEGLVAAGMPEDQIEAYLNSEEGANKIGAAVASLSDEQKAYILGQAEAGLTDEQKAQIREGALSQLTDEQKAQIREGALAQLTDEQKAQIKAGAVATLSADQKAQIREGAINQGMAKPEVQEKLAAAAEGVKALAGLKAQLDSYNEFYTGLQTYTAGVASAANGAGSLKSGADSLKAGTSELSAGCVKLYDGALQLKNGCPALVDGITKLRDGSMQLNDGLKQFDEQGVQKIIDAVDGDLTSLYDRLKATADLSKSYKTFSGVNSDMEGTVKFIYRTDSVE